jgi:hypothetical protein
VNWSEERYVRLYTRTTNDLLAFGPEGRHVWYELLRAADRAGVIDTGGDLETMPELLRVTPEVWAAGWPRILKRGSARVTERAIVLVNYIEANEAKQSDAQRQRESRARRTERTAATEGTFSSRDVTSDVTPRDAGDTSGHTRSQSVTPCRAVPDRAVPCRAGESPAGKRRPSAPPKVLMPDGWAPGASAIERARQLGLDLAAEEADFREWTGAQARRYADWDLAFLGHLRRRAADRPSRPAPRAAAGGGLTPRQILDLDLGGADDPK